MRLPALDNLVRAGQLKVEPRNDAEGKRMLALAQTRLADAQLVEASLEGRFTSPEATLSVLRNVLRTLDSSPHE